MVMLCSFSMFIPIVLAQGTPIAAKPLASGSTRIGLEIGVVELSPSARHDQFGQALARFGSCPPGLVPKGMDGIDMVVPGNAAVLHFTLKVAASYAGKQPPSPPVLIDADGDKHRPHGLYFMPEADALNRLKNGSEALHCELTYAVSAGTIVAVEFEGAKLSLAKQDGRAK